MKKVPKSNDFPFVQNPEHIYNFLSEENYNGVQIGHNYYEFELHQNITHNGTDCDGLTLFNERKIQLDMGLDDDVARETLLHEIIHCLMHSVGVDERNFDGVNIIATNEFITDVMSKQLMLFNFQNPGLIGLLFS